MAKKKVLIVDDSVDSCFLLESALRFFDLEVAATQDGQSAVEMASSQKFDLIIVDWHMPGLDGFETARKIWDTSAMNSATKIIVFTSSDSAPEVERCKKHGFADVLSKSFEIDNLEKILKKWIS